MKARIRIGTRGSRLAIAQATWVRSQLLAQGVGDVELVRIKTTGDRLLGSLAEVGGKGLFVKEIEQALLSGRVDLAVHSMKDLPGMLPPGLAIVAVPKREDTRDLLISNKGWGLKELPSGATVGTSSLRRKVQLLLSRPDLKVIALRGNVDTRLRKLHEGEVDAVIVAAAGLNRLGIREPGAVTLAPEDFIPAIGQGALALEARDDCPDVAAVVGNLGDPESREAVTAERAFLAAIGGDCQTPVAAHATRAQGKLHLSALLASPDGSRSVRGQQSAPPSLAEALGRELGEQLLSQGGAEIMTMLGGPGGSS